MLCAVDEYYVARSNCAVAILAYADKRYLRVRTASVLPNDEIARLLWFKLLDALRESLKESAVGRT